MMAEFFLILFFVGWVGLIVACGIRIFFKIKKSIHRNQLKKSLKLIKGDKE
jgi:hypothetical protein